MYIVFDRDFLLRDVCEVGEAFRLLSQIKGADSDSLTYKKLTQNLGGGGAYHAHTKPDVHVCCVHVCGMCVRYV